jgi:Flp pilus assembly pilin Flp
MRFMTLVKQLNLRQLFVESGAVGHVQAIPAANAKYQFFRSESGSVAVEYALILGLICGVISASVQTLGNSSVASFRSIDEALRNAPEFAPRMKELTKSPQ